MLLCIVDYYSKCGLCFNLVNALLCDEMISLLKSIYCLVMGGGWSLSQQSLGDSHLLTI